MRIDILTLFPDLFEAFCRTSIVGRAVDRGLVEIHRTDIRAFARDRYGTVDDTPYGGGVGMVLKCEPIFDAVDAVRRHQPDPPGTVVLLSPQGQRLTQKRVAELAAQPRLILIAGHYEGFDERVRRSLADVEISLGDFVLSGGEVAAMALSDAVVRLQSGALGKDESVEEESFSDGLLEYPQYTRPREYRGMGVPDVLLSGDHGRIARWRKEQAEQRTRERRPDLWDAYKNKHDS
ncbi:MAG: tRNA (guanosine(37)-N1)-methyltransferase TrmD [Planctomycetota bacterium]